MKDLNEDIKTGSFRHAYLLYGAEDYLKIRFRDRLVSALLPEDNGMNLSVFDGDRLSEGAVIDQGQTLPFFADRRVIRLDHTGLFKTSSELLPDYIRQLPDYLYLVFTENEIDRRSRLFKAVQSVGRCVEFAPQTDSTLSAWTAKLLGEADLRIRKSDMEYLLARTGTDMNHIFLETDKLIHYCAGKGEVTRKDIDLVVSYIPEDRIFDMITAVTEHRGKDAMKLYADLLALKEAPMRILSLIAMQFNRLLMVSELSAKGMSDAQIAGKAGMPPFAVKRSRSLLKNSNPERLRKAVSSCVRADEDIKSGRISDRLAVELLLIQLS